MHLLISKYFPWTYVVYPSMVVKWRVFSKLLEADFNIIFVLTEIGSRNINTVKYLLDSHEFDLVAPVTNMYGGVGIYVGNNFA